LTYIKTKAANVWYNLFLCTVEFGPGVSDSLLLASFADSDCSYWVPATKHVGIRWTNEWTNEQMNRRN